MIVVMGGPYRSQFFAIVSRDNNDQEFAARRQRFLAEQGYAYQIADADSLSWLA
jgi:DNA excision repair protein ERCC-3